MARTTHQQIPKYRLHKASGQGVVTLAGRDVYLGKYGTPESREHYDRLIAEWLASGRRRAESPGAEVADLTIVELIRDYLVHAKTYYRKPDGRPTSEFANTQASLREAHRLYGRTLAREFTPANLKAVRAVWVREGIVRGQINNRVARIVRMFRWAVENSKVSPEVWQSLKAVSSLRAGRSEAVEGEKVRPVPITDIEKTLPHLPAQVAAMVQLQRLSGCRPGEVVLLRGADIDQSGTVWVYRPEQHKTEHHGHAREIYFGGKGQEVLQAWLRPDPEEYLFQPREAEEDRNAKKRAGRKSPMTPSQRSRKRLKHRSRPWSDHYSVDSYRRAIRRACDKAGVEPWHPHQLRHTAATEIRRTHGLEMARVILGHSSPVVTAEHYAELDRSKAMQVMTEIG